MKYTDMVFGNETEAEAFAECNGMDKDASIEDIARAIASLPYHKDTKRTVIITQVRIFLTYAPIPAHRRTSIPQLGCSRFSTKTIFFSTKALFW